MKRSGRRKEKIMVILIQTLLELLISLKYAIIEEIDKIAIIIQMLIPVLIAKTNLDFVRMIILSCIITLIVKYIKEVGYKLNNTNERGIPISRKRFTKRDGNGLIGINEEDMQEAILYLCDIEDYMRSRGKERNE